VRKADLARYRVLSFATHGLMAGEYADVGEPALVLTPPAKASADDDGLLTASEIARLRLDADWVLLSACNTAAPDGTPGAEGLSGLARAFFYAGSRSLLVSHWAVASDAAVKLTTGIFAAAARDPGIGRAEAHRRAMLALMADRAQPYNAHPMIWAPFVVVGEGAAPAR
jgi:CHAT domain-containing protein